MYLNLNVNSNKVNDWEINIKLKKNYEYSENLCRKQEIQYEDKLLKIFLEKVWEIELS